MLAWILFAVSTTVSIILLIKIVIIKISITEIKSASERLSKDKSYPLILISSRDKHLRSLAATLNKELVSLKSQKLQYELGDASIKNAAVGISHDLRTPLTAICGYVELVEKSSDIETAKRYAKQIKNRADAIRALSDELLQYFVETSSIEPNIEHICINKILEDTLISYYGALSNSGISPIIQITDTPVYRYADALALSRIFSNLISNALKYSDGDLNVTLSENGTISFSNTASSLSSVDVNKLFDKFYTVDDSRKSTGLGLSIAKMLAEQMGGNLIASFSNSRLTITLFLSQTKGLQ